VNRTVESREEDPFMNHRPRPVFIALLILAILLAGYVTVSRYMNVSRYIHVAKRTAQVVSSLGAYAARRIVERSVPERLLAQRGYLPISLVTEAQRGNIAAIQEALASNVHIDAHALSTGMTLLHHAASERQLDLVKFLVEQGADPNVVDRDDSTPLQFAAYKKGNGAVLGYLLELKGADVYRRDQEGLSARDYARFSGDPDMLATIESSRVSHTVSYDAYPASPDRKSVKLRLGEGNSEADWTEIPLALPVDLDDKTVLDVRRLRGAAVEKHLAYFSYDRIDQYVPDTRIFGSIVDRKPWYGVEGLFLYGPGPRAAEGVSQRSKSIVNPLALLWPSFFGPTLAVYKLWDEEKLKSHPALIGGPSPLTPFPRKLRWSAQSRKAVLEVNGTEYREFLRQTLKVRPEGLPWQLEVETTNARDVGLNYWKVDERQSRNIFLKEPQTYTYDHPIQSAQYYHVGFSCRLPGGCNNLSPYEAELDGVVVETFPAVVHFDLWNSFDQKSPTRPDFSFVIDFK
jgi:hypothetical protein